MAVFAHLIKTRNKASTVLKPQVITSSLLLTMSIVMSGCMSTAPSLGGASGQTITGGAAGGNSQGENSALESCTETLGTLSVFEDRNLTWWYDYRKRYPNLGSTVPVIRTMIQQSNCFVIVERGRAMAAMNRERELMQSGQIRQGSNIGGGQMVAADYTISPEIQFAAKGTEGFKAIGGALLGSVGALIGGGMNKNEAATTLLLIDNRSGVQVSAAAGSAGNFDYNFLGGLFTGGLAGGGSAYSNTPEGKVITAAFADSYNQMVKALRNYKTQQVKGGLGKGGRLTVGGPNDQMPTATKGASIPVTSTPVQTVHHRVEPSSITVHKKRNYEFEVDEYDEDALNDYYQSLKNASTWASGLATYASSQESGRNKNMMISAIGMLTGQLATHKIELESWPHDAKVEGWKVLGSKIEKYNKLFEKHRTAALKLKNIDPDFSSQLQDIELITYDSLFGS